MFKTNKKKNLIKSILIIFIILIPYFLSGQGESYSKKNQKYIKKLNHQNKYHQNKYHQNISLKKRIYNFFYQRKNYALIQRFFLKKKKFIIMNHPSEAECLFKKIYYKKALIHFNNIMTLFKKELYNNIIKKIALCNFYLKKSDLAINFFKILLKDNAEENIFHLGMCYYLQSYIKIFLFLRKNYPNTKYLPKIEKMICVSYFKKEKRVNILIKKKYKSSVNDYQDVFNIQKDYIYMIISQSKVEKENSCFEETMKLHNTYFIYKMKILFLMRLIYLYHRKFKFI
ncbi:hypothetical protein [Candidatus Karelsulcia muelleri]|uniref:hypothetical protein n=1 Tax=Candidatus Karelsulcia muelleri TaxID=336810 RepID=UPI002169C5B4|nr:hypothetical protein [Candidatus Karelsulcia muelleri]